MAAAVLSVIPCDTCIGDKPSPAKFHCNTCGDGLCATCKIRHLKSKGTKHHIIVPYAQKLDPKHVTGLVCHVHHASAEVWCETCGVQVCISCITKEHLGHMFSNLTSKLSKQRDDMLSELKVLRDTTLTIWEDALKQAEEIAASYTNGVEMVDSELVARAKEIHNFVDNILSKRRRFLKQSTASRISKLKHQEKYLAKRVRGLKDIVQLLEDQLMHTNPNVLLQFKPGTIKYDDRPELNISDTDVLLVFTKGDNDINFLDELFGKIVERDDGHQKATTASVAEKSITRFHDD